MKHIGVLEVETEKTFLCSFLEVFDVDAVMWLVRLGERRLAEPRLVTSV
jgi:hypothetical protein